MIKPKLRNLWTAFPDHVAYPTLKDLYTMLGGSARQNIDAPGFGATGNTCASRLSVAFNKGGAPISRAVATSVGARTIGAGDGSRIIFAVAEFRTYLLRVLGKPALDNVTPFDDSFRGRKGIIAFGVTGWDDATGHIALFDGRAYREPSHDDYSSFAAGAKRTFRGELWELA